MGSRQLRGRSNHRPPPPPRMSQYWAFQLTTALASQLPVVHLDAHVIQMSFANFAFIFLPLGVSVAATVRVGTCIGQKDGDGAR